MAFDPKGKTFRQRVDACLEDAKKIHGVTVRQDSGRTAEWQHRLHVCHMFLYNKYTSHQPAKVEAGKRTLSWAHLSDAKTVWSTIPFSDLLRTKTGNLPVKVGQAWVKNFEPDRAATEKRAKELLAAAGIGSGGQAMVSAGLKPCGEPCRCTAGRSNHLEGAAADFDTSDMGTLTQKLTTAKAGTIDDYLKKFGLHRPLLNHPTSPEAWHIEAMP
jgi:hypothetical protein